MTKLEHIGIAVKSIDQRLRVWQDIFGLKTLYVKDVPDQKVRVAVLGCGGIRIELLEAIDKQSPIHSFIQKRGEGIHHFCFAVENIERKLKEMKDKNIRLVDKTPRIGASGKKIAFIHPQDMGGVLIELTEPDDVDNGDRHDQ